MGVQLARQLQNNDVIVIVIPKDDYSKRIINVASMAAKSKKNVCYVTLNKPTETLLKQFKRSHIDTKKFFFVDAVAATIKATPKKLKNRVVVQSPHHMSNLSIAIAETIEKNKCKLLVFDSLSTLLVYHSMDTAIKYAHYLVNKSRGMQVKTVLTTMRGGVNVTMIKDLIMFADKVIRWY